jgi:carboxybiotin decarboxylase
VWPRSKDAASIGGGEDPTSIFITIQLAPLLLGVVAVAASSSVARADHPAADRAPAHDPTGAQHRSEAGAARLEDDAMHFSVVAPIIASRALP